MTLKDVEVALRELHKLISDLADKVGSLERKVCEQSVIIINQTEVIKLLKTQVEGKQPPSTKTSSAASAPAQPALQRPIRQARIKASSNITAGSSGVAARKPATKKDKEGQSIMGATTPKCDGVRQDAPISTPTVAATGSQSRVTTLLMDTPDETRTIDQTAWQEVSRKRRTMKQRPILTGSGKSENDGLQSAERLKFIQAWSFKPETSTEDVRNHIRKIEMCEKYVVEKRVIKTDQHAAFVIGFPETLYDRLCTPNAWPPGIKISDWFRLAPRRSERGSLAPEAD
ncbi:Conserved oligomeric Golgi complex component 6, partial [Operophtera brumata]